MSSERIDDGETDEAARWFAALNTTAIPSETLEAFHAWRRIPANDAAYRRLESTWSKSRWSGTDPRIAGALAGAHGRAKAARGRRQAVWWAIGGGLAIACACGVYFSVGASAVFWPGASYQTALGEQRTIVLAEGTRVHLDTDSRITVRLSAKRRDVVLEKGQAFFDVAHLANRPFNVSAGATTIHDLGTRFDVRRDDGHVQVTLLEGAVQVVQPGDAGGRWSLTPGQQLVVGTPHAAPKLIDTVAVTSWTKGRLVFNDMALSEATAEMNRYAAHKIVLASPDLGDTRVTGQFDTGDTEGFVSAVAKLYDLSTSPRDDGAIVLSSSDHPKPT